LLALLVVVGGAAGVLYYLKQNAHEEPGPYGAGPLSGASAKARPDWITAQAQPGQAFCSQDGGSLSCVGVSMLSPSQEDAEDEASDAAIEAVAFELGKRITDKTWVAAVPPIYLPARDAKLAAMNRDLQSSQARRDVRDGRRAVAHALRTVTPTAAGRYWEAYGAHDGRRLIAFVQVKLASADADKLIASYTTPASAMGATAVSYFPELAWKYGKIAKGAIVTKLEPGVVQQLGLAEKSVVVSVDGREANDADAFAKILTEEYALLQDRGGAFRLLVQSDNGDPREFSTQFPGKVIEIIQPGGHGGHGGHGGTPGTGGVNVWDRFGGNHGSGRDDPTQ
jgi:hypothetical protein